METNLEKATAFSKEHLQDFIKELQDILRIKSISSDPVYKSEMIKCADWLVAYLKGLGVTDARSMDSGKNPIVFGSLNQAGAGKPTILIYGHYDVQPPDPLNEWTHDPFDPVIEGNLLLARGSSDMKGQAMIMLSAIKSILAFGSLPVNLKFLFEGDEEVGSPSIVSFLNEHKELFKSDFVLNLDAGMVAKDKPTIVYGLRGLAYFEISVRGPAHDLHSGVFGGSVLNPAQALCHLIAGMHDDKQLDFLQQLPVEKQKEILLQAYNSGYFDHPRKVNAGELARKLGMHKTTLLEHLHKAEKRLIGHIIEQTS